MAQAQREMSLVSTKGKSSPAFIEFVIIISMMMALTALSIDAMLPALPQMGDELGVVNPNDRQLIVSLIFLGSAFGQLFFGPLSDKTGRKPAIFTGYAFFITGSLVSVFSVNFPTMLVGRILQGLGLSFFCTGILFRNMNALVMQPLGHLAGIGAAVIGSMTTLIAMLLGTLIGQSYNGTILPLVIGMTVLTGVSVFVILWAESK